MLNYYPSPSRSPISSFAPSFTDRGFLGHFVLGQDNLAIPPSPCHPPSSMPGSKVLGSSPCMGVDSISVTADKQFVEGVSFLESNSGVHDVNVGLASGPAGLSSIGACGLNGPDYSSPSYHALSSSSLVDEVSCRNMKGDIEYINDSLASISGPLASSASSMDVIINNDCNPSHAVVTCNNVSAQVFSPCLGATSCINGVTLDPSNNKNDNQTCSDYQNHSAPTGSMEGPTLAMSHDDGNNDLSSLHCDFLSICMYVDNNNVCTHVSSDCNIGYSMRVNTFTSKILPLLNLLSNHKCDKISINATAWNTHGLLGSNHFHYSHVHAMKDRGANRLLTSNHVTALLEIHADELECGAFHNEWKHSHCFF